MKVLQINVVCGVLSTGKIATDLRNTLIARGHECKIAYGRFDAKNIDEADAIRVGGRLSVKLHAVMTKLTNRQGFYSTAATKKLINEIKEYEPDIIQLHNIHGYYLNIKLLFNFLKQYAKPVVFTLHDCWSFTGHCFYYDLTACQKWQIGCESCPQRKLDTRKTVFANVKRNYNDKKRLFTSLDNMTVVGVSRWISGEAQKSFLNKYKIITLINGIDLTKFKRVENAKKLLGLPQKFVILGVSSNWVDYKGINDFNRLADDLGDSAQIVLVGKLPQGQAINDKIIHVERTDSANELCAYYSAADAFVNPTMQDNAPMVNMEALACGAPVIVYKTGGAYESIDESCGLVVERGNYVALLTAVNSVLSGEVSFKTQSCIARSAQFDKNAAFDRYIKLYEQLLGGDKQ